MNSDTEILDCLLISPPIFYDSSGNIWKEINSNFPPLGIASIAAYIRYNGYKVRIIDCNVEVPTVDRFESYLRTNFVSKYSNIRFIGITSMTPTIKKAYKIAELCKKYFPNAQILFGGVHPTYLWSEVIKNPFVDIVVIGEGEKTLNDIVSGKKLDFVDGIVFKRKGEIIQTPPRKRILKLDELPMPAYDLLPISKYRPAKGSYKRLPAMSMMTSRGCPGRCTFCSKTLGNLLVFRSAEKIFEEILYLKKNFGIREILFYDDTFTANRKNVLKLCELIIKNKIDITFTCFARVDFIDFEMLRQLKRAGCHQIMYGIESVDETVLRNINKKINIPQVKNAVTWTKKGN